MIGVRYDPYPAHRQCYTVATLVAVEHQFYIPLQIPFYLKLVIGVKQYVLKRLLTGITTLFSILYKLSVVISRVAMIAKQPFSLTTAFHLSG